MPAAPPYDWGDTRSATGNYGTLQIHNHNSSQVLLAFNRWGGIGGNADIGIGNNVGNYLDWTSSQNAAGFAIKTLQVFVLPADRAPAPKIAANLDASRGQLSMQWGARPGTSYSIWKKTRLDSPSWTKCGPGAGHLPFGGLHRPPGHRPNQLLQAQRALDSLVLETH